MDKYTPKLTLKKAIKDCLSYDKGTTHESLFKYMFEELLELERDEFLGYPKNVSVKPAENKRNGYYTRMVNNLRGSFSIKVPRDRQGDFVPTAFEIIKKDEAELKLLAYKMYSKGLSTRDTADIIKDIFGKEYSPQSISNITKGFENTRFKWQKRSLEKEYYFIYVDAIHTNIRRDTVDNEAIYVVLGVRKDLEREVLGIYSIPEESSSGWKEVFEDLKSRNLLNFLMCIADGITGLENALTSVYPKALLQKCVVHKIRKILLKCRASDKAEMASDLSKVFDLDNPDNSIEKASEKLNNLSLKWKKSYPWLMNHFSPEIISYYFNYLKFPVSIRRLLYTTNWIERLNKHLRKVIKNKNSFPNENSAINLLFAAVMEFEEDVYIHKITNFVTSQYILDNMLVELSTSDTI